MVKAKYLASCHKCQIAVEVEENVLTQRDYLYCQHCNSPLEFKFIKEPPEVQEEVKKAPAPPVYLTGLLGAVERLEVKVDLLLKDRGII